MAKFTVLIDSGGKVVGVQREEDTRLADSNQLPERNSHNSRLARRALDAWFGVGEVDQKVAEGLVKNSPRLTEDEKKQFLDTLNEVTVGDTVDFVEIEGTMSKALADAGSAGTSRKILTRFVDP